MRILANSGGRSMKRILLLAMIAVSVCLPLAAQTAAEDQSAIRAAMQAPAAACNRGDIPAFMRTYEDSDETTFIGLTVRKGYQPILKRYQENYTNREQMG